MTEEPKKEMTTLEMMIALHPTEYQKTLLFKLAVEKSPEYIKFRKAWKIPTYGFNNHAEYIVWYQKLIDKANLFLKSKKREEYQNKTSEKKKLYHKGKITQGQFLWYTYRYSLVNPIYKFDHDVDQMLFSSGKPEYWRDFIEDCLLYKNVEVFPVTRPVPEAKLKFNVETQTYDLIVENIFPDTIAKDFDNFWFTDKFKTLQKKLVGYQKVKPRFKKKLNYGLKILEADQKSDVSDWEKAEEIDGDVPLTEEPKRRNNLKQTRHRLNSYLKKEGDIKRRS